MFSRPTISVEITFRTKKLGETCNDSKRAGRELGAEQAKRSRRRLADLASAANREVMRTLPGRTHELSGDRKGEISIDLKHPYRLLFIPNHTPAPTKADGGLDWSNVTAIEIIDWLDTHD